MPPNLIPRTFPKFAAQVPAKDIVARAAASRKDGDFLCPTAEKLSRVPNGHEEDGVFKSLFSTGMLVNVPYTYVDLGADLEEHPAFRPRDFLSTLCDLGKFSTVIGVPLESATVQLEDYWAHFCNQYRQHPIVNDIKTGVVDPAHLVPLNLHGDGGRTYKKQELMVLQWQSAVGAGTSKSSKRRKLADEIDAVQVNLKGHSFSTRYLISVLHKKHYREDATPLLQLLESISEWFGDLYQILGFLQKQLCRLLRQQFRYISLFPTQEFGKSQPQLNPISPNPKKQYKNSNSTISRAETTRRTQE